MLDKSQVECLVAETKKNINIKCYCSINGENFTPSIYNDSFFTVMPDDSSSSLLHVKTKGYCIHTSHNKDNQKVNKYKKIQLNYFKIIVD